MAEIFVTIFIHTQRNPAIIPIEHSYPSQLTDFGLNNPFIV